MKLRGLIILLTMLHFQLFALDTISAIPEAQKKVLDNVIIKLQLPDNKKVRKIIFDKLQPFFIKEWSAHWTTNSTAANSKIKKSDTRFVDLMIYHNGRVTNINFIFFKKEKQLVINTKEYIEGKSDPVLQLYNKTKNNDAFELGNEANNYAYFNKKGYMEVNAYHIKTPCGMVIYESTEFKDID